MTLKVGNLGHVVCDSCLDAVRDEGFDDSGLTAEEAFRTIAGLSRMMGADLVDHLCDEREGDITEICDCGCNRLGAR